jgi:hypothetical protein
MSKLNAADRLTGLSPGAQLRPGTRRARVISPRPSRLSTGTGVPCVSVLAIYGGGLLVQMHQSLPLEQVKSGWQWAR